VREYRQLSGARPRQAKPPLPRVLDFSIEASQASSNHPWPSTNCSSGIYITSSLLPSLSHSRIRPTLVPLPQPFTLLHRLPPTLYSSETCRFLYLISSQLPLVASPKELTINIFLSLHSPTTTALFQTPSSSPLRLQFDLSPSQRRTDAQVVSSDFLCKG